MRRAPNKVGAGSGERGPVGTRRERLEVSSSIGTQFPGNIQGLCARETRSENRVGGALPAEGAVSAFETATNGVLQALKSPGAAEKVVDTGMPMGSAPAGQFAMFPFMDIVVHKWDLAKATNQDMSLDSSLAEAAYNALSPAIDGARQGGAFGPEVQVPINASIQDKLLAISGRQP